MSGDQALRPRRSSFGLSYVTEADDRNGLECIVPPHMVEEVRLKGTPEQKAHVDQLSTVGEAMRSMRTVAPDSEKEHPQAVVAAMGAQPEAGCGPTILVFDMKNSADPDGLPGHLLALDESSDDDAERASAYAKDTWTMFASEYGRNSLDGLGMPLISSIHFGSKFNNAFWNGSQMAYGDGDGVLFNSFTSARSVVAHELSHGVVQYSGGLVYQDQSGALNEHLADVFGALTEQRIAGQQAREATWLVGEGLIVGAGMALRSLAEPGTAYSHPSLGVDPQPYHMNGYVITSFDHGGVHINSGIPNHAFYLAAMMHGGAAWEDMGRIWYGALQSLNNSLAQFADFADLTENVAITQFGTGSAQARRVRRAWQLVGVL